MKRIELPLTKETIASLKAGDEVALYGKMYTARDQAHQALVADIEARKELPVDLDHITFYYAGPTDTPPGAAVGSIGPTTSSRMDAFSPILLKHGHRGMIGKGERSPEVVDTIVKYGGVYFSALGGAGALLSQSVKAVKIVGYPHLGTEAIRELDVEGFPCVVAIDSRGNNLFAKTLKKAKKMLAAM